MGSTGTVTVEARFDAGYFVSVALGQRAFRGMLYYPPQEPAQVRQRSTPALGAFHAHAVHSESVYNSMQRALQYTVSWGLKDCDESPQSGIKLQH